MTQPIDVCLLLEGTYPYVRGGVSSWINQLILSNPDLNFGVVFLGSTPEDYEKKHYQLPEHVVYYTEHFLFDFDVTREEKLTKLNVTSDNICKVHQAWSELGTKQYTSSIITDLLAEPASVLQSEAAWEYLCKRYQESCPAESFIDYYWTVRNMHIPLWQLAKLLDEVPRARVYHSISTGYAGMLGALLHKRHATPFFISEHGIYTKERRIDLFSSLVQHQSMTVGEQKPIQDHLQKLWIRFFESIAKLAYQHAHPIVSLFSDYQIQQIRDGANKADTRVIANGIDIARFKPCRKKEGSTPPPVIALIGRIVPIKDIKTFIRAMGLVIDRMPHVEGWIVGPEDEDPEYANECKQLITLQQLDGQVQCLGQQDVCNIYPKIAITVISSISEGLPLVVLESFASGVPVISTAVGACPELINGKDENDKALGQAGRIINIADAEELAKQIISLLTDNDAYRKASTSAIERVETHYQAQDINDQYRTIYAELIPSWQA